MKVTAWVMRFTGNCRSGKREYINGPLTTQEINDHAVLFWIKRVQSRHENTEKFKDDQQQLGLQKNEMECMFVMVGFKENTQFICLPLQFSVKDW